MAAELTWYEDSLEVDEPRTVSTTKTFTIKNVGDETATELGFYISVASSNGSFEFPSTDSPDINYSDIISQGNIGYGLTIQQSSTTTRILSGVGDTYPTRIPLVLGSGTAGDELAVNEEVTIVVTVTFSPSFGAKNLYVDLFLE